MWSYTTRYGNIDSTSCTIMTLDVCNLIHSSSEPGGFFNSSCEGCLTSVTFGDRKFIISGGQSCNVFFCCTIAPLEIVGSHTVPDGHVNRSRAITVASNVGDGVYGTQELRRLSYNG